MFITRLSDVTLDGTAPVLQYGYGGFALAMLPTFSVSTLLFCKIYRALYALPNIRLFSFCSESGYVTNLNDDTAGARSTAKRGTGLWVLFGLQVTFTQRRLGDVGQEAKCI